MFRSMIGYEQNTDHRCVNVKLRTAPKKCVGRFYNNGGEQVRDGRPPRLQVDRLKDHETCEAFNQQLHELAAEGFLMKATHSWVMRYGQLRRVRYLQSVWHHGQQRTGQTSGVER